MYIIGVFWISPPYAYLWYVLDSGSSCSSNYNITLGSSGLQHQPSTGGLYTKVCTTSDDNPIYKKEDDSLYLFYVEFNASPFWAISNKIGGSSMIIKSVQSSPPYCPGPESNGVWLIITGTGSGDVRFFSKIIHSWHTNEIQKNCVFPVFSRPWIGC